MRASNPQQSPTFPPRLLELHSRSDADRPGTSWHHQRARAAPASGGTAEIDALVEEVRHERFDVPPRPVQSGVEIDQGRRVQASLEIVRVGDLVTTEEQNCRAQ